MPIQTIVGKQQYNLPFDKQGVFEIFQRIWNYAPSHRNISFSVNANYADRAAFRHNFRSIPLYPRVFFRKTITVQDPSVLLQIIKILKTRPHSLANAAFKSVAWRHLLWINKLSPRVNVTFTVSQFGRLTS